MTMTMTMTSRIAGLLLCVAALFACGAGNVAKGRGVFKASETGGVSDPYAATERVLCHFEVVDVPSATFSPDVGATTTNHANYNDGSVNEPAFICIASSPTNNGFDCDGVNDNILWDTVTWSKMTGYTNDTKGCVSVWTKCDTDNNAQQVVFMWHTTTVLWDSWLYCTFEMDGNYVQAGLRTDATEQWKISTANGTATTGVWHHVAVTQNGTTPAIYLDGAMMTVTTNTSTDLDDWFNDLWAASPVPNYLELGLIPGGSSPFDGQFDEFRVSTNYQPQYVLDLYNNTHPTNRIWPQ